MSKRITIADAKKKRERELEIQEKIKNGSYRSSRVERRRLKRLQHEKSWFEYIKLRGGIKEKKEKKDVQAVDINKTEQTQCL